MCLKAISRTRWPNTHPTRRGVSGPLISATWPELIERTPHAAPALIEHVRVDHRRAHIPMSQQLLDGSDVVARLEFTSAAKSDDGQTHN